jgi:hypothetical protein
MNDTVEFVIVKNRLPIICLFETCLPNQVSGKGFDFLIYLGTELDFSLFAM